MRPFLIGIRSRFVPAVLTAAGATLVAAGLLSYTAPVGALPPSEPPPTPIAGSPSPVPSEPATPSVSSVPSPRVASRIAIPALRIDLPVVRPARDPNAYPWCNVAMYLEAAAQPGEGRATYLYAHAREGMFLPILEASMQNNGRRMRGMLVQVWTSDDMLFVYEIVEVRRHQTGLDDALKATTEQLWLQTSEGPRGTVPKTQVIALQLSSGSADPADAHPRARPVVCG